jgi:hypothetical protein
MIWVFEIIRDGIHTNSDWNTLRLMDIFNIILFMFRSSNEKFKVIFRSIYYFILLFKMYYIN